MAIVTFRNYARGQNRACMSAVMKYAQREDKVRFDEQRLVTGINCRPDTVYDDFMRTKQLYHKEDGVLFYHMVQSFPKGADVDPKVAHAAAIELAGYFKDCEVLVCTHTDRDHIHSHCIINSVNFETGKKLHMADRQLQELRARNDMVCVQFGLPVFAPKQEQKKEQRETKVKPMTIGEYHIAAKGQSWKFRLMGVIDECMQYARTREEFIALMRSEGYDVRWSDTRKYITYTTPDGDRCRDNKLHSEKYLKEAMENEFGIRQRIVDAGIDRTEPATGAQAAADRDRTVSRSAAAADAAHGGASDLDGAGRAVDRDGRYDSVRAPRDERDARVAADEGRRAGGAGDAGEDARGDATADETGWEKEREAFLAYRLGNQEVAPGAVVSSADSDMGVVGGRPARSGGVSGVVLRESSGERHRADTPVSDLRLRAAGQGFKTMLEASSIFDDDNEDAEERRRRIEAQEAAQNLGAVVGLAAGLAVSAAEKHRQREEQLRQQQEQQQMQQQSM